ncbi:abortive infection family protein [Acinetobacter sp. BY419]|uniref:abortive infection family protein n=1 Tax=Acinetobacter sp. BY419 TaxID=2820675 RepID=UPI001C226094|nr:abortive infection family protein [Acinetobacter sp. BY419]
MDQVEKLELSQNILLARATHKHQESDDKQYQQLRNDMLNSTSQKFLPSMVKTSRNLDQFWQFIKSKSDNYSDRRTFIYTEFQPSFDFFEKSNVAPLDNVIKDTILKLDSTYIQTTWDKALERRLDDPQGAITLARTLIESTCKHILDELEIDYGNSPDINQLYRLVSKELNLSPSQHTEQVFKQILGGCSSIVEGLGALRNKVGDAHGQGKVNVKPSSRHAELAVNLAGTMAVFLFTTWGFKKESLEKITQR